MNLNAEFVNIVRPAMDIVWDTLGYDFLKGYHKKNVAPTYSEIIRFVVDKCNDADLYTYGYNAKAGIFAMQMTCHENSRQTVADFLALHVNLK